MPIPIKGELAHALIERRFGSVDNLVVEWEHRIEAKILRRGEARNRNTIYRWLKKGLPSQEDELFAFAGLLDVDPVALVDINQRYVEEQFGKERYLFHIKRPQGTYLAPLWSMYLSDNGWPNQKLAETYYGHRWHFVDFTHDPGVIEKVYVAVVLECQDGDPAIPRVYHFAYRRLGVSDKTWRPYGVVIGLQQDVTLVSESGHFQVEKREGSSVVAETYFGTGPAEFRVVSIHPFTFSLEVPSERKDVVRFRG